MVIDVNLRDRTDDPWNAMRTTYITTTYKTQSFQAPEVCLLGSFWGLSAPVHGQKADSEWKSRLWAEPSQRWKFVNSILARRRSGHGFAKRRIARTQLMGSLNASWQQ